MLGGYLNAKSFRRKTRVQNLEASCDQLRSERGKLQERQNQLLTKLIMANTRLSVLEKKAEELCPISDKADEVIALEIVK